MNDIVRLIIEATSGIVIFFLGRYVGKLDRYRDRDRKLLLEINNLLPKEKMTYYKERDFSGVFSDEVFFQLTRFEKECEYPQNYFLDKKVENLKQQLLLSAKALSKRLSEVTVPVENPNAQSHRLPQQHIIGQEKYNNLSSELNRLADKFYEDYTKFVITAERKLS